MSIVLPLSTGLILISLIILLSRKKGKPLDKETKRLTVLIFVGSCIVALAIGIFPILAYFNVPPSSLILFVPYLEIGLIASLIVISGFYVYHKLNTISKSLRKKRQYLLKKYTDKLTRKIFQELQTEVETKDLQFFKKRSKEVPLFAQGLAENIAKKGNPIIHVASYSDSTFGVERIRPICIDNKNCYNQLTFDEAKVFANKMTEIDKDKRFRKNKVVFYLTP